MGLWTFYFFAKLYLHYRGSIRFDVLLNVLFLVFLVIPPPKRWEAARLPAAVRQVTAVIIGIALLWHDSWLPEPRYALRMLQQGGALSREYLYQFVLRLWSPKEFAVLAGLFAVSFLVRRYRTAAAAGTALLVLLPLVLTAGETGRRTAAELDRHVGSFINAESLRSLPGAHPGVGPPFDIIILQICSLAWDDLRELGMESHPFFKQFELLFTGFNSVTTYSNPAAIRLLNGACGQRRHADLYTSLPPACSLMDSLRAQGYAISYARNHNGIYGEFDDEVRRFGRLDSTPFAPAGLEAKKYMFDDSPVYDDYALLAQWWTQRTRSRDARVALYYNSVSLHDGSHWIGDREWWKRGHRELYREFLDTLLQDLSRFFDLLDGSGRSAVVVVLGEHGRAVRGNAIETPGLRDIPLPRITLVPVGIKIIGKGRHRGPEGNAMIISKPASYFGLASVLRDFADQSPFGTDRYTSRSFIDSVPQTAFVAENENNLVVQYDDEYYFHEKGAKWIRLSGEALK